MTLDQLRLWTYWACVGVNLVLLVLNTALLVDDLWRHNVITSVVQTGAMLVLSIALYVVMCRETKFREELAMLQVTRGLVEHMANVVRTGGSIDIESLEEEIH